MPKKYWYLVIGLVGIIIVGVVVLLVSDTAQEVFEIAGEGGEMQLREPMRPLRGSTRVLLIGLDGVGVDEFAEAVRAGTVPRMAGLLGAEMGGGVYANAYQVPDAVTILPSTTMACWASIFTGKPAAETGVPGNEWFSREEMRFYAPGPTSVSEHEHTFKMFSEGLLGDAIRVPTIFEQLDLRAFASLSPVHRGADLFTFPDISVVAQLFGRLAEGLSNDDEVDDLAYSTLDLSTADVLLESFETHGIPDLQVVYFPGVDLYTHLAEPPLEEQHRYMQEVIDPAIGRILDAYAAHGVLDDTYVIFVSDHGHTPVLVDNALGTGEAGEPPELIEQSGFRMRPMVLDPAEHEQDYQAAVAYQGAMAFVYLADRSTCPNPGERCAWMLPPRLEEDVMPLVRAFDAANRTGELVPELQGTLDLIFAREPRPPGEDALPFQVFDGERLVPIGEYLEANPRPDLIQLERRMDDLAAGPYGHRAGDILLLARSGMNRPITERYYFSRKYRSWHGSPEAQDSKIPLVVARQHFPGDQLREMVNGIISDRPSQLDVAPLVLGLMNDHAF